MKKTVLLLILMLGSITCFGQKYVCEFDFDGAGNNIEVFEFDMTRTNKKIIKHGDYEFKLVIEKEENEWDMQLYVFNYKVRKESLYEASTQYSIDTDAPPFHMFLELFVRDAINILCDCQRS